jgi:hypothetical protein
VNSFKILQDRSKTNIFVSNCLEGKTKKNEASFFLNKAKKNEYNRSASIEDLPLLVRGLVRQVRGVVGQVRGVVSQVRGVLGQVRGLAG